MHYCCPFRFQWNLKKKKKPLNGSFQLYLNVLTAQTLFLAQGICFQLSPESFPRPGCGNPALLSLFRPLHICMSIRGLSQPSGPNKDLPMAALFFKTTPNQDLRRPSRLAIETPVSFLGFCFFLRVVPSLLAKMAICGEMLELPPGKFFGSYLLFYTRLSDPPLVLIFTSFKKSWMATWAGG